MCRGSPRAHRHSMNQYLIQREIPGAGRLSRAELQAIAQKSNGVIADLAPRVRWVQSYVTDDAIFCVYHAESEDDVREHGRCGGFPVDAVHLVGTVIDPTTAGEPVAS